MKKTVLIISALCLSAFATPAFAEEGRGNVGLGTYNIAMAHAGGSSDAFLGTAITANYGVSDLITIGGHYYFTEEENSTSALSLTLNGFDLLVKAGKDGLGFTYFGGLGVYSETMEFKVNFLGQTASASNDFSGALLAYGLGYNWDALNLTYEGSIRSTGDYEADTGAGVVAATGSLSIAYRF